jgi:hypothetical protein
VVGILGFWAVIALANQSTGVMVSQQSGSRLVSTFTQARILALRARADDELTLLTRDSDPSYQQDYVSTEAALAGLLRSEASRPGAAPAQQAELQAARSRVQAYQNLHQRIRRDDVSGDPSAAITLAAGTAPQQLPATSNALDTELAQSIDGSHVAFDHSTAGAASDLNGLAWALGFGLLVVLALLVFAFRPRLEEYR